MGFTIWIKLLRWTGTKKKTCFIGRLWLFTQQSADCGMNYFSPSSIQSWRKKIKRLSGSNTKGSNPAATRNQERNILCSFSIYFRVRNQRSLRKIGPNDKRRKSRRRRWFSATGNGKQTSLVEMPCILIEKNEGSFKLVNKKTLNGRWLNFLRCRRLKYSTCG